VRFKNNKAKNIVAAREKLIENGKPVLKRILSGFPDVFSRRDWLVANIRGMGYKEGSHFLRNIGMGENLAILDRHVFTHMLRLEIIPEKPASLSPKRYLELEEKLRQFARKAEIPLAHLDILFWYLETGAIFK
jgi:N-glycosylase/DNA lyase